MQAVWDGSLAEMLVKVQAQMQVLVAYEAKADMRDGNQRRSLTASLRLLKVRVINKLRYSTAVHMPDIIITSSQSQPPEGTGLRACTFTHTHVELRGLRHVD